MFYLFQFKLFNMYCIVLFSMTSITLDASHLDGIRHIRPMHFTLSSIYSQIYMIKCIYINI